MRLSKGLLLVIAVMVGFAGCAQRSGFRKEQVNTVERMGLPLQRSQEPAERRNENEGQRFQAPAPLFPNTPVPNPPTTKGVSRVKSVGLKRSQENKAVPASKPSTAAGNLAKGVSHHTMLTSEICTDSQCAVEPACDAPVCQHCVTEAPPRVIVCPKLSVGPKPSFSRFLNDIKCKLHERPVICRSVFCESAQPCVDMICDQEPCVPTTVCTPPLSCGELPGLIRPDESNTITRPSSRPQRPPGLADSIQDPATESSRAVPEMLVVPGTPQLESPQLQTPQLDFPSTIPAEKTPESDAPVPVIPNSTSGASRLKLWPRIQAALRR